MSLRLPASIEQSLQGNVQGSAALEIVRNLQAEFDLVLPAHAASATMHPVVVLEGMDGTGKSTLAGNLATEYSAKLLKTPPEELRHLRPYFDEVGTPARLRRAFYMLGNYACALRLHMLALEAPVVVDRFWPSTVAYHLAHDLQVAPPYEPQLKELLEMPRDLCNLLPRKTVFLLLALSEEERASRVRARAAADGPSLTAEEEALERSRSHRDRLMQAYHELSIGGDPLNIVNATGTPEEVKQRVVSIIGDKIAEWSRLTPISVNWHYTRQCNYKCKFCFHTATSGFFLPSTEAGMRQAKECLLNLRRAGMQKMNFSGGEPFLHPDKLGELCRYLKEDLRLESVSIISNGSLIERDWFERYASHVDILAISCESFHEETNALIGRGTGRRNYNHLDKLFKVRQLCREHNVRFKLNSVINRHNWQEDMVEEILKLEPVRWKVFQCLLLEGENSGNGSIRDARGLVITRKQFMSFVQRHSDVKCLVWEDNERMKDSYLILNEQLCFLDCTGGGKTPSRSLRDVTVNCALKEAGFDAKMFKERGGIYDWSRPSKMSMALARPGVFASCALAAAGVAATFLVVRKAQRSF